MEKVKICHVASGDLWAGAEAQLFELLRGFRQYPQYCFTVLLLNEGRLAREIRSLGVTVVVFDEVDLTPWQTLRKMMVFFREKRFDVIHTHRYKEHILAGVAAYKSGIPVRVATAHGRIEFVKLHKLWSRNFLKFLVLRSCFHGIVAVSDDLKMRLRRYFSNRQLVRIHNAIAVDEISYAANYKAELTKELNICANSPLVGIIGRLAPIKNHQLILRVWREIDKDAHLLIIGDGPLREELQAQVHSWKLQNVHFLGYRDNIRDIISCLDMLVVPSKHEGIPIIILEALAMKKPVVAAKVGGIPEIINFTEEILIAGDDVQQWQQVVCSLLEDAEKSALVANKGYQRVKGYFDTERMVAEYHALYQNLLGR